MIEPASQIVVENPPVLPESDPVEKAENRSGTAFEAAAAKARAAQVDVIAVHLALILHQAGVVLRRDDGGRGIFDGGCAAGQGMFLVGQGVSPQRWMLRPYGFTADARMVRGRNDGGRGIFGGQTLDGQGRLGETSGYSVKMNASPLRF